MIRLHEIKIDVSLSQEEALKNIINKKIKEKIISQRIVKSSIDARDKDKVMYVYEIDLDITNEESFLKKNHDKSISLSNKYSEYTIDSERIKIYKRPVIIGFGPAGMFTSYICLLNGLKPIIIERGQDIDNRVATIEKFWQDNALDENSNIQFGEGGAGTFSDGKLNTLTHDKLGRQEFVLKTFVKFGAKEEILYDKNPHIGTDILQIVVKNMRKYLVENGAEIYFNTTLTNMRIEDNLVTSIELNHEKWLDVDYLFLAIGHSARDTFHMLADKNIKMMSKPFAVGLRIMHNQEAINKAQYGKFAKYLGPANYKLTHQSSNGHGVYTFCMCPGGYVVNASSVSNQLAINGMSYANRDSNTANSAIVVTVNDKIYGEGLFAGLKFQEKLEKEAYHLGRGLIPLQLLGDYYTNTMSTELKSVKPAVKGQYTFANLNNLLPDELNKAIKETIPVWGKKIKGFDDPDAILAGVESRTSSPITILRDESYVSNIKNLYPCGEGAGYAGGIMTSAIDGMKVAEALSEKLRQN